ncbi:hypothetical protein Tco_1352813 [Tanacetum coccineum]
MVILLSPMERITKKRTSKGKDKGRYLSGKRSIRRIESLRYDVLGISWSRDHVRYLPEYFISIWLEYGVLVFPGYGVLDLVSFMVFSEV